jgi:parvulin-like peptidyl-prolyl isomerase
LSILSILALVLAAGLTACESPNGVDAAESEAAPTEEAAAEAAEAETAAAPDAEAEQGPVAKVGDTVITRDEYDQAIQAVAQRYPQLLAQPGAEAQLRQRVLQDLITQRVLLIKAEEADITVDEAEVEKTIAELKEQIGGEEQFAQILQAQGLTEEELREDVRQPLLLNAYIEQKTADIEASDEAIQSRYEELQEEGKTRQPATADVEHILVQVEGEEEAVWEEKKKEIEAARARVMEGEDFGDVREDVSEDPGGGVYPDTPEGMMVEAFEDVMFDIEIGKVSEPFRTEYGWHILRVTDRTEAKDLGVEEMSEDIEMQLTQQDKMARVDQIIEEAREDVGVEILIDLPQAQPQQPMPGFTPAPAPPEGAEPAGDGEAPAAE